MKIVQLQTQLRKHWMAGQKWVNLPKDIGSYVCVLAHSHNCQSVQSFIVMSCLLLAKLPRGEENGKPTDWRAKAFCSLKRPVLHQLPLSRLNTIQSQEVSFDPGQDIPAPAVRQKKIKGKGICEIFPIGRLRQKLLTGFSEKSDLKVLFNFKFTYFSYHSDLC